MDSGLKKKNSSFEDFSEFITTVHNKLGLVSSTTNQAWEVNVNFGVDKTVIMQQETIFEHGTGFETFSFVIRDEKILLEGYNIISLNLTPEDFAPVITE